MIYETYYELNQVLGKFDDCKLDFTAGPFSCMKMLNNTTEDNDDDEVEVEVENITEVEVNLTSTRRKNNKRISNGSGSAIDRHRQISERVMPRTPEKTESYPSVLISLAMLLLKEVNL